MSGCNPKQRQRARRIITAVDGVTGALQQALQHDRHHRVIVDHQHPFTPAAGIGHLVGRRRLRNLQLRCRQVDLKSRARAGRRLDGDRAAVRPHDAVRHRQAKTGAGAHRFGGEEGVEDSLPRLCRHATAIVGHPEAHMGAGMQAQGCSRRRRQLERIDTDLDPALAIPDRVPGIGAEIEQHLLDLGAVDADHQWGSSQPALEGHLRRQGGPKHVQALVDHRLQGLHQQLQRMMPAEGQDLADQLAGAVTGGPNHRQFLLRPLQRARFDVAACQVCIADDRTQHIVEVVGDAAGQGADRLHLLRLAQLRFQQAPRAFGVFAGCQVTDHDDKFQPRAIADRRDRNLQAQRPVTVVTAVELVLPRRQVARSTNAAALIGLQP